MEQDSERDPDGRGAGVPRCVSAGAEDAGTGSQEKLATVKMMQNKTDKA